MWGLADSAGALYALAMDTILSFAAALWPVWVACAAGVAAHFLERT